MSDPVFELAAAIQGEAGICGVVGMIAVYYVFQANHTFYGWQRPNYTAYWVATHGEQYSDPTRGAYFLVSKQDLADPRVAGYTWKRGPPNAIFLCAGNLSLWAYPLRKRTLSPIEQIIRWSEVEVFQIDTPPKLKERTDG